MGKRTGASLTTLLLPLLLLAGCGGDDSPPSDGTPTSAAPTTTVAATTTSVAATTTTRSAEALKAALLQAADVPGTTATPASSDEADLSQCVPGNPLAAKTNPTEVDGPELEATSGSTQFSYGSSARVGTPEQAKAFVAAFASPTGSTCALDAFKVRLAAPPNPVDPAGLTVKPSTVAVGDGGSLMTVTGNLKAQGQEVPLSLELYLFSKGGVVVFMTAGAINGTLPAGQGLELAKKVAGRLS